MTRILLAVLLTLVVSIPQSDAISQFPKGDITKEEFSPSQLICYIQNLDSLVQAGMGLTCSEGFNPALDLFFMSSRWHRSIEKTEDCDCDQDFDGISGCDEIVLCLSAIEGDTDGDCLVDGLELILGTHPADSDSDGDGTADGDEDSDLNGTPDRDDDYDQDALTNCEEASIGTNPILVDSDQDGWPDGAEVQVNNLVLISDPRDPQDTPHLTFLSQPPVSIIRTSTENPDGGSIDYNTIASAPPVQVVRTSSESGLDEQLLNTVASSPPVSVVRTLSESDQDTGSLNTISSSPPVTLIRTLSTDTSGQTGFNTVASMPPTQVIRITTQDTTSFHDFNTFSSNPPAQVIRATSQGTLSLDEFNTFSSNPPVRIEYQLPGKDIGGR